MIKQIHSQILFAYVIISMRGTEQGDRPRCIVPLSSVMWAHGWSDASVDRLYEKKSQTKF